MAFFIYIRNNYTETKITIYINFHGIIPARKKGSGPREIEIPHP